MIQMGTKLRKHLPLKLVNYLISITLLDKTSLFQKTKYLLQKRQLVIKTYYRLKLRMLGSEILQRLISQEPPLPEKLKLLILMEALMKYR